MRRAADPGGGDLASSAPALAAMLGSMASVQVGSSFAKTLFPLAGAAGTTALRVGIAAVILAVVFRPWRRPPTRAAWRALVAYGVALGLMNLTFYSAIARVPLGIGVAVEFAGPLTVAVATSRRRVDFLWVAMAAGGLLALLPIWKTARPLDPLGVTFALAAGVCWGLYIVFGQRAGSAHGTQAAAIGMALAAVIVLPIGVAAAGPALLRPAVLESALGVAVLSSVLPYTLDMFALPKIPARVYGTLMSLAPAAAALAGFVLLHETLSPTQGLAITVIVAASVGVTLTMRARRGRADQEA